MEALLTEPVARAKRSIALKNILFPTDFSDASQNALQWASALARHYDAKLHLAHVTRPTLYPGGAEGDLAGAFDTSLYAEPLMKQLRKELEGSGNAVCTHVVDGLIEDVVPALISVSGADWMVLGTHGRTGLRRFFLGSIAEEILRVSAKPVLTLSPSVLTEAPPAGAHDLHIGQILCLVDFAGPYQRAIESAVALAEEYDSHLTIMNIMQEHGKVSPAGDALLLYDMQQLLRHTFPQDTECRPDFVVELDKHPNKMADSVVNRAADLIVQTLASGHASGRSMDVIRLARCPVLTIPQ